MPWYIVTLTIICGIISFAIVFIPSYRTYWVHKSRNKLEVRVEELQWYRIVNVGKVTDKVDEEVRRQAQAISKFADGIRDKMPYRNRGVISFVWNREENGLLQLYVGVSGQHSSRGAATNLASALGSRAEEISGPPEIALDALVIAKREAPTPSEIAAFPKDVGDVARTLNDTKEFDGSIIMTIEMLREGEGRRLRGYMMEEAGRRLSRVDRTNSSVGENSRIMTGTGVRGMIGVTSRSGSVDESASILRQVTSSMGNLGVRVNAAEYGVPSLAYGKIIGACLAALIPTVPLLLVLLVSGDFIPLLIVLGAIALTGLAGITFLNNASCRMIAERLEMAELAIPPYIHMNPVWGAHAWMRKYVRRQIEDNKADAPPSGREVIPLYRSSLCQFVSMPPKGAAIDLARETVPSIGLPADMELSVGNDDSFVGLTGTGQPYFHRMKDINSNFFVSGSPNMGKSNLLQIVYTNFAWLSHRNERDLTITPIWTETKGSGALDAWRCVRHIPGSVFIDTNNPDGEFRLALEGRRLSEGASVREVVTNVNLLVTSLQFAFHTGIMGTARPILNHTLRCALLLNAEEIRFLGLDEIVDPERPNIIQLASYILGINASLNPGPKMVSELAPRLDREDDRELNPNPYSCLNPISTIST